MERKYSPVMRAGIFSLIFLACAFFAIAQERFIVRVSSFPNELILVDLAVTPGRPLVFKVIQAHSCLDAQCSSKYNLAADLTTISGQFKDIAINNVMQSSTPKISGVCSDLVHEDGNLKIDRQRSFTFPAGGGHTGIAAINVFQDQNRANAAFFRRTSHQDVIGHTTGNFNVRNCNISGPFKEYYRIAASEFQTSIKSIDGFIGAITKKDDDFEFNYANVLVPGFIGKTKLSVPGGSSVTVVSASLAFGASTAPGAAGIPANQAFLLYRIQRQRGNGFQSSILLQSLQMQGTQLSSSGAVRTIAPFTTTGAAGAESVHSVALGPDGDFAIYTVFNSCGKEIVKLQKLNPATGAKVGPSFTLLDCARFANSVFGAYAIDLIPLKTE